MLIGALVATLLMILNLVQMVVIVMIIMSWLFAFNVINGSNQFVATVWKLVDGLTQPLLQPIRRIVPNFGGLDVSPIVLFIIIYFLQVLLSPYSAV